MHLFLCMVDYFFSESWNTFFCFFISILHCGYYALSSFWILLSFSTNNWPLFWRPVKFLIDCPRCMKYVSLSIFRMVLFLFWPWSLGHKGFEGNRSVILRTIIPVTLSWFHLWILSSIYRRNNINLIQNVSENGNKNHIPYFMKPA